ncbi:MAG: EthD domain-containing protein [Rhodobacter sp.]|nr:EthD domain-containing protein [Rhodobacter sp.]MCA3457904.1 EthD domain-containing protein [Rhodobacter sp.]MCA3460622.1 EthD domain-containing protein [Rhodobacter sp.]MCA3463091.1 EthD domain-containing protein [Rhodobacter sp.]MCA3467092.1 EthD domain-containing protein [Rhodobacter sp.]
MVKVFWLLKRAEGLSRQAFADWWLNRHAPYIAGRQGSYLAYYSVNLAVEDDSLLPAGTGVASEWDGLAEEVFHSVAAARAALTLPSAPEGRADVLAHVSRFERIIVEEHVILPAPKAP